MLPRNDGRVDAVAAIVFADPAQRRRLEALTHPWIKARRDELFAAAPADAPARMRKMYPSPPRTCLVRALRIQGRLGVSARPVKLDDPQAGIDKVRFVRRGRCHLLRMTLSKSEEASVAPAVSLSKPTPASASSARVGSTWAASS